MEEKSALKVHKIFSRNGLEVPCTEPWKLVSNHDFMIREANYSFSLFEWLIYWFPRGAQIWRYLDLPENCHCKFLLTAFYPTNKLLSTRRKKFLKNSTHIWISSFELKIFVVNMKLERKKPNWQFNVLLHVRKYFE